MSTPGDTKQEHADRFHSFITLLSRFEDIDEEAINQLIEENQVVEDMLKIVEEIKNKFPADTFLYLQYYEFQDSSGGSKIVIHIKPPQLTSKEDDLLFEIDMFLMENMSDLTSKMVMLDFKYD